MKLLVIIFITSILTACDAPALIEREIKCLYRVNDLELSPAIQYNIPCQWSKE
jgi:hypothetical protein